MKTADVESALCVLALLVVLLVAVVQWIGALVFLSALVYILALQLLITLRGSPVLVVVAHTPRETQQTISFAASLHLCILFLFKLIFLSPD